MAHKKSKTYKVYKRGEIIYVDFPDKDGHEIRGPHYAVIMTRKDNYKNPLINVIPLTSKDGRGTNFHLGKCFTPGVVMNAIIEVKNLLTKIEELGELHKEALIHRKSIESLEEEIKQAYGVSFWEFLSSDIDDYFSDVSQQWSSANDRVTNLKAQLQWFRNFSKNTYAITSQITTVDKKRILPTTSKRKLMESITLPPQQLRQLEKEICYKLLGYSTIKSIEDTGFHW